MQPNSLIEFTSIIWFIDYSIYLQMMCSFLLIVVFLVSWVSEIARWWSNLNPRKCIRKRKRIVSSYVNDSHPRWLLLILIFHEQVVEHYTFINPMFQTKCFLSPKPLSSVLIFDEQVEQTVNFAMDKYNNGTVDIINLLSCERESLGVSKILRKRLFSM